MIRRLTEASESAVVALAMTGDDRAFHELVLRRQAKLRSILRRLCGSASEADDLAQLAFLKAWKSLPRLRSPHAFSGWLRAIAVNVWLEEVRRSRLVVDDEEDAENLADDSPTALLAEGRIDLERALASLRPAQRLCLVLAYAEGMTHSEIAEASGFKIGVVKSHIARGAARLRRWYGIGPEGG